MQPQLQRALHLIGQSRFELAEGELRLALADNPDDAFAHALMAICLAEREVFDEATREAQHAIHLEPDLPFSHYALATIMLQRNRDKEAEAAIYEAIRLDPDDERYYGRLSQILFKQRRWQDALEAADRGLMIDAGDDHCANLRTMALMKLGRTDDANRTIDQALERNPDDALTHANQGWTLLEQGDSAKALEHFREALRIDASLEWARLGVTEALKSRYFVYRIILAFFFKMARLSRGAQWGIIVGGVVGMQVLQSIAHRNPSFAPFVWPILFAYLAFVIMTWIAEPLFNLLLRINRFGRYALSREQTIISNWVGGMLLAVAISVALFFVFGTYLELYIAFVIAVTIAPLSRIYHCESGWPRISMILVTVGLFAFGTLVLPFVVVAGVAMGPPHDRSVITFATWSLPIAVLGSQFAANYLVQAEVRV